MHTARCHCGAVVVRAFLPEGLLSARRCTCSFCRRRGAAAVTALTTQTEVLQGADVLTRYAWGTGTAQHYFCSICGIYTHHQRRSDPSETGINLGCIDDVYPHEQEPISYTDGINHPSDR
ncbi:MAG: GFA family protein [Roseobacter sp.]|nr:GFA family protein [Roseobacter sp.]